MKNRTNRVTLDIVIGLFLSFLSSANAHAAAPARSVPYAEAICSNDPNVFFCEDFQGGDLRFYGHGNSSNYWKNPAFESTDLYWADGGSHQRSTTPLSGFDQSNNIVYRVAKSGSGFTDILWGNNTGTGAGTLNAFLSATIRGTGIREWYHREQVYFSSDFTWPSQYDVKTGWTAPMGPSGQNCMDLPSCAWEGGMGTTHDTWCSGAYYSPSGQNFPDSVSIRYNGNFGHYPYQNNGCPALALGASPDGTHVWRFEKNRWYTVEYHYKLSSSPGVADGKIEMWVDGQPVFSQTTSTCDSGCPPLWYAGIMVWMNSADSQTGFVELDNFVMSKSYIGPPTIGVSSGTPSAPTGNAPTAPTNLSVQ